MPLNAKHKVNVGINIFIKCELIFLNFASVFLYIPNNVFHFINLFFLKCTLFFYFSIIFPLVSPS